MNKKIISAALSMLVLIAIGAQLFKREAAQSANVSMRDGIQIIDIKASPTSYEPSVTLARANIATTLQISSARNYGCTRELQIDALQIKTMLPTDGLEALSLGKPKKHTHLDAVCSMGMYRFSIDFE